MCVYSKQNTKGVSILNIQVGTISIHKLHLFIYVHVLYIFTYSLFNHIYSCLFLLLPASLSSCSTHSYMYNRLAVDI